jgi:hypothetical protein
MMSSRLAPCDESCLLNGESGAQLSSWITSLRVRVQGSPGTNLGQQIWSFGEDNVCFVFEC